MTKVIDKKLEKEISNCLSEDIEQYNDFEQWVEAWYNCPPNSFIKLVEDNKELEDQIWEVVELAIEKTRKLKTL